MCATNDTEVDLVVVSQTPYTARFQKNSVVDTMFKLNVRTGTEAKFQFRLVASGTDKAVQVNSLIFSVLDLDGQCTTHERITAPGYSEVAMGQGVRQINADSFESARDGTKYDNPTSVGALDTAQTERTVSLRYRCLQTWEVTFSVSRGRQSRNFYLGGATPLMPANYRHTDKLGGC